MAGGGEMAGGAASSTFLSFNFKSGLRGVL